MPRSSIRPAPSTLLLEREALQPVCGVDEAGRGPLAGPVMAAAVILDSANVPDGIGDSKALTAVERERVFGEILIWCDVSVASLSAAEIDRLNIRRATLTAMRRAVQGLARRPAMALIDGRDIPPDLTLPARAVIGGDALSLSIGAASIVAKVLRDRMMIRLDQQDPRYGFAGHMGYPTPSHRAAILTHGASRHHRMTFGLLKSLPPAPR